MTTVIAPVTKTLVLECTPERAFAVFTDEIETWWPLRTHSVYQERAAHVVLDDKRIYETSDDGTQNVWGDVLVWDPPKKIVFTWAPSLDKTVQTEVTVSFEADGDKTRFVLIHSGWERFGEEGHSYRGNYDNGWDVVLAPFVAKTA
jgi:uncharacterized protein YndB with AHSA1/START domain